MSLFKTGLNRGSAVWVSECLVTVTLLAWLCFSWQIIPLIVSNSHSQDLSQSLTESAQENKFYVLPLQNGENKGWIDPPNLPPGLLVKVVTNEWKPTFEIFLNFVIEVEIFLSCRCPVRCKLFSSGEITEDLDIFRSHNKMLSIICLLSSRNGRNGKYPNNCRFCHISGHFQVSRTRIMRNICRMFGRW